MSIKVRVLLCAALTAIAGLSLAASAQAAQQIDEFTMAPSTTAAGAHPDIETGFSLVAPGEPEAAKDVIVDLPEGVFGNPNAITTCRSADYALSQCPVGSQAGLITMRANYGGNPNYVVGTAPLYNMDVQSEGETARFSFIVPGFNIPIAIPITVRTADDYGLRLTVSSITQQLPLAHADLVVWGFPADPVNDADRFRIGSPGNPPGCVGLSDTSCNASTPTPAGIRIEPLIDNPTICTGQPQEVKIAVRTYQDPGALGTAETDYPASTECEEQTFNPVLNLALTTDSTDSPAGMDLQLKTPQFLGFSTSPSQLRSARVTLPEGLTINPDAADGQTACPDALARFDSEGPALCPDSSKIGNFDIRTPALIAPLEGSLFFGEPKPGDQYRVIMVASGFGINAKLVASAVPDPATGQVTMSVTDLPQVPFEEFNLRLFASQRGLLATPTHCRVYAADSTFVPWNDKVASQRSRPTFSLESGPKGAPCPGEIRPFHPRLEAGTTNPVAGDFSNFALKLDRDDGDQYLGDLNFRLPPGFTGSLRGIPYCPEGAIATAAARLGRAELAAPSCPAASQVGTTNVSAGPGTHPFNAVGRMYLAGPLKGAPLSLAAITPALAGPFDYGVQVVRVALSVDPITAQVFAASDRMPQIIGGVPLRMRSIRVNIDRPNFTINPTNCRPMTVDSQGIGDQGTVTDFSSRFKVVNCGTMPFKPRMTVKQLGGKKRTKRDQNAAMRFELRTRPGDANISRVKVTLPKAFAIDQEHLGNICSKAQLEREMCAGRQRIGNVFVRTPLLDEPLRGPAYAVSGFGRLPRLAFILDGQVRLVPQAESASNRKGQLRTIVPIVPDAPIGYFRLNLLGGKKGYLVNTRSLCGSGNRIRVDYVAHSGRKLTQKLQPKTACRKGKKKK